MPIPETMTAEQFVACRPDLPDGGRWTELIEGELVSFDPPTHKHGSTLLNLSKVLGEYLQEHPDVIRGSMGFELGLILNRNPDTLCFPDLCYCEGGPRFFDPLQTIAEVPAQLVIEVISSPRRFKDRPERVALLHAGGIQQVWFLDTCENEVSLYNDGDLIGVLNERDVLSGGDFFPGFQMSVERLFSVPDW